MSEPAPWTKIYNRVKAQIPSVTDAMLRAEISNIVLDFTQDTNLWLETVDINVQPTVLTYPFTVSSGSPNRLMVVYKDGDINQRWADNFISMRVPGILQLNRSQPEAVLWHAVVAKATSTAQLDSEGEDTGYPEIDSWIIDQFSDVLYYGVMWLLQRQPAKSYRDPNGAKENSALYNSQKAMARGMGIRANVYNGQTWQYPQGFATVSRKGWA